MAVNGFASAQVVQEVIEGTAALAAVMGARVDDNDEATAAAAALSIEAKADALTASNLAATKVSSAALAAATGLTLAGFRANSADAILRNALDKIREFVSPEDVGAVGDGVADDTVALQKVFASFKSIRFRKGAVYKVSGTFVPQSGTVIDGNGAALQQVTNQTPLFNLNGVSDLEVHGLEHIGKRSDFLDSPSSLAVGYKGNNSSNIRIYNCKFKWFGYASFAGDINVNGLWFYNNDITGPGLVANGGTLIAGDPAYNNCIGVVAGNGSGIYIMHNRIRDTAIGIIIAAGTSSYMVDGNEVENSLVEHGGYFDAGGRICIIRGNRFNNTYLEGMKVQYYDAFGTSPRSVIVANNISDMAGTSAISILSTGGFTQRLNGLSVTGNIARNPGQDGITIHSVIGGLVANNTVINAGRYGISAVNNIDVLFNANAVYGCQNNGFYDGGSNNGCVLSNSVFRNPGLVGGSVEGAVAIILNAGLWVIDGNKVFGDNTKTRYGFVNQGASIYLTNNLFLDAKEHGIRLISGTNLYINGNIATGLSGGWFAYPTATTAGEASHLYYTGTAVPSSGTYAAGARIRNIAPSSTNPVTEWVCTVAGSPGTWRAVSWLVARGTTAQRPTLTASDVGVMYLDNTLDADGKPIWWNGTAWLDATGATV